MPTDHTVAAQVDAIFHELGYDASNFPDSDENATAAVLNSVSAFLRAGRARLTSSADAAETILDEHLDTAQDTTEAVDMCQDLCTAGAVLVARWLQRAAPPCEACEDTHTHDEDTRHIAVFDLDGAGTDLTRAAMLLCNTVAHDQPDELAAVQVAVLETHGPVWTRHLVSALLQLYVAVRQAVLNRGQA